MIQLVYLSSARPSFREANLAHILEASRRRNARAGITGMLLYGQGSFLQLLEGEAGAVETCLARIAADPRHSALRTVVRHEIAERDFGDWTMGFRSLKGDEPGIAGFVDLARAPLSRTIPPSVSGAALAFLQSFHGANVESGSQAERACAL